MTESNAGWTLFKRFCFKSLNHNGLSHVTIHIHILRYDIEIWFKYYMGILGGFHNNIADIYGKTIQEITRIDRYNIHILTLYYLFMELWPKQHHYDASVLIYTGYRPWLVLLLKFNITMQGQHFANVTRHTNKVKLDSKNCVP